MPDTKPRNSKPQIDKYGLLWDPRFKDELMIEMELIRRGGYAEQDGITYGKGLFHHSKEAQTLIWPEDDHHRWSDQMLNTICEQRITVVQGSRDCVAGHTRIFDPLTGRQPTIRELYLSQTAPMVMTTNGPERASVPFIHGEGELLEVRCSNGTKFTASGKHVVLTAGGFDFVSSLQIGQHLISYAPPLQADVPLRIRVDCKTGGWESESKYLEPESSKAHAPLLKVLATQVQSIRRVGEGVFYDLTVSKSHHYFAEGTIHHNTGKTHGISKWGLVDYWAFPETTLTLISSTGMRELELRVWGDVKDLFRRGKARFPWLAGKVADKSFGIFTDLLEDTGDVRDVRKGIICVPCLGGDGEWVGMERYVGIKQKRRRLLGDEMQFMHAMYVNVLDAIDKGDFKGVFVGNPIGGNGKALDKIAEPKAGWSSLGEVTKTRTWENKYGGVTLNLVGTDSPNFDPETPNKYPYLINQADVDKVAARNGKDSAQMWTLIMGVRKTGVDAYRVLTVELCERHGAFNTAVWSGTTRTKIYAVDAGFGGDPCEVVVGEFGEDATGRQVLQFSEPVTIPIAISRDMSPEDQIALYIRADCDRLEVPDTNVFYDAGMRATLPVSLAQIMSSRPTAINFGGPTTERPVNEDVFTIDLKTRERRPLKCNEQYSKFVTELHYSMRELVEAKQCRSLPRTVAEEFAMREWHWVPGPIGQRYELETKAEFKKRMGGESPNKSDATSIVLEGARRLGFQIKNPKEHQSPSANAGKDWLEREVEKHREFVKARQLTYR